MSPLECYLAINTLPFIACCLLCWCRHMWQWVLDSSQSLALYLFSWLGWSAPHKSCHLWSWNWALYVLIQCYSIKVAPFIYLRPLFAWLMLLWLIKTSLFLWFRVTWHAQLVCYYFRGLSIFQLLGAHDRYKALTILSLSPQKESSLINFLYYLAVFTLVRSLLGLCLMFWSLLCLANIWACLIVSLLLLVLWGYLTCLAHSEPSFAGSVVWFTCVGWRTTWSVTCECDLRNPCA